MYANDCDFCLLSDRILLLAPSKKFIEAHMVDNTSTSIYGS